MALSIDELMQALRKFAEDREWEQFHSPKNLACSVSVEAAELLELFQWLTDEQSRRLPAQKLHAVGEELADVFLYLLQLADKLNMDIMDLAERKLAANVLKYPADQARGNAKKYTEL